MKRLPILCLLAAFALLLASCKNSNKSDLAIPKDAAVVFHINSSSLSSKLSWDEIKKTEWYKDMKAQAEGEDSLAQKIIDNPEASGVDMKADFVFFIKKQGAGGYSMFEGGIKDAGAFEAVVKKMSRQDKVEKDGDWKMVSAEKNSLVAWNDKKFAVINDMPFPDMNPMARRRDNDRDTRFTTDSLKIFLKQVMNLSSSESLFDDDRFASVMKDNGDMHLWFNTGVFYNSMGGMLSMMKAGVLLEGNASAATMSFDDGKITVKGKQFYNKEMQKLIANMKMKNVDAAVLNRIPSTDVIAVMAFNLDPNGIKELMKTVGVDGMANSFLGEMDLTLDEVVESFKGDFLFSFSDLKMKDTTIVFPGYDGGEPTSYKSSKPDGSFLVAASVNKKTSFEKLLSFIPKEAEMGANPFSYKINNDWFVGGNKSADADAFLSGKTVKHDFADKIGGHPFGMYVDIQRILKTNFSEDSLVKEGQAEAAKFWKDMTAIGYEFKDGVALSEFTINMVDTKTNSLKQISQFAEKMNALRKKSRKVVYDMPDDGMMNDSNSTMTAPMVEPPPSPMEEKRN